VTYHMVICVAQVLQAIRYGDGALLAAHPGLTQS
jgi:hypothetical protein